MGCPTCHKAVEGKKHPEEKKSVVLAQKIPALCYGCHEESIFKGTSGHSSYACAPRATVPMGLIQKSF